MGNLCAQLPTTQNTKSASTPPTQHAEEKKEDRERRSSITISKLMQDADIFAKEAVTVAFQFWNDNLLTLSEEMRKEIGVTLYAQMFRKMPECRSIFLRGDIQGTSAKFLGMIGWLVTSLESKVSSTSKVWELVIELGKKHRQWGIHYDHYLPMLEAFHTTFQERFPKGYTMRVKFCIENLFMNAARLMTQKDFGTLFMERVHDLETLDFLDSLDACLAHATGREYLDRYMEQCFMKEYVIFFRLFDQYKQLGSSGQRYEKGKDLYNTNFSLHGAAFIELEDTTNVTALLATLEEYDESLDNKTVVELSPKLLDPLYQDVKTIVEEQCWQKFCSGIHSIKEATRTKHFS